MEIFLHLGLIIYIAYLPISLCLLIIGTKIWGRYSLEKNLVSELGISTRKSHKLFSIVMIVYALLSIFVVLKIGIIFPNKDIANLLSILLCIVAISTTLVAIYKMDLQPDKHLLASIGCYGFAWVIAGITAISMPTSPKVPNVVEFVCYILLLLIPIYGYTYYYDDKEKLLKHQKFLVKHAGSIEWTICILLTVWNLMIAVSILVNA